MEPIRPQPGSASDPRNFVGRERTTARARRALLDGNSLSLTDPRRMGKTFWMTYFAATSDDFAAVRIDYEGVRTAEEFLVRTAEGLGRQQSVPRKARQALRSLFDNVEEVGAGPVRVKVGVRSMSPTRLLTDTVLTVNEHATQRPVLVCMDEVPLALRNLATNEQPSAANEVLQTLRSLRGSADHVRWIVCGSVGFHHVLRQCGATEGDINDLVNLPLGPLDEPEAEELAERLLLGIQRQPVGDAVRALAECSGGIPFLLHKVASLMQDSGTGPVTAGDCAEALDAFIDDRDESRAFTHFLTRLDPNYGADADLARKVLNATAAQAAPTPYDELSSEAASDRLNDVLDYLIDDHYLVQSGESLVWRYDVLRRIWQRRRRLRGTS